jgi:hypothetical protein
MVALFAYLLLRCVEFSSDVAAALTTDDSCNGSKTIFEVG